MNMNKECLEVMDIKWKNEEKRLKAKEAKRLETVTEEEDDFDYLSF